MTDVGRNNVRAGFTLIELMIAITILAIISAIAVPAVMSRLAEAKIGSAKTNLNVLKGAIMQYQLSIGQLPSRLKDLIKAPSDEKIKKKWNSPFIEKEKSLEDPWENPYQYKVNPAGAPHQFELYSYGPNGKGSPQEEQIDVWKI